jgi:Protein of unknown function (DUF3168)
MNPIRRALFIALSGDSQLTALLSAPAAIHHQRAPQTATYPFVIFHRQAGTPSFTFGRSQLQSDLWLIKGVDLAESASKVEDIAARIDTMLRDASLSVAGRDQLDVRRESDVDYAEADGDITYRHCGALYRIVTESA